MSYKVCVVGGGVIGLSTAVRLQQSLPNVHVTIISDKFSPDTTGDGSAGFWRPYFIGSTPKENVIKWGKETFDQLMSLSKMPIGGKIGVFASTGYDIFKTREPEEFWKDIVLGYHAMNEAELKQFPGFVSGYKYTTMMCECRKYLPWLMEKFLSSGGQRIQRKVEKLSELCGSYNVVVNCTGVWAHHLANDANIGPLKGQLIVVEAPWLKHFVNAENEDLYILVGSDNVALGGTHDRGNWDTGIDPTQRKRIWDGCCKLVPSLAEAKVVKEWAGLRPSRTAVRLEKEVIQCGDKMLKVVHNYGHGGSGVTVHWGCASEAVQLVRELMQESRL